MREEFKQEAGDDTCDSDEQVCDDENDVGRTGLVKHERYWVHHRGDRPSVRIVFNKI